MKSKVKKSIIDHNVIPRGIVLLLFSFIGAITYNCFIVPNNLVCGGMSGLAIVLNSIYELSPIVYLNILSIITIILGFIILGPKETMYGIIGYLVYTLMLNITAPIAGYFEFDFDSPLLNTVVFGAIHGAAFGFVYRTGFNTAGTDTIIEIFKKYRKKPITTLSNIINGLIIFAGFYIFGIVKTIYAIIFLIVNNKFCDICLIGHSYHKLCMIHSKNEGEIIDFIKTNLKCGFTILDSTNGIGFMNRRIVLCVIPIEKFGELKTGVLKFDKRARIISKDCYNVEGGTIGSMLVV